MRRGCPESAAAAGACRDRCEACVKPIAAIAKDLQMSESCLRRWMDQADVDDGHKQGVSSDEHKELVELRRKNRVLEMEVEILKRASAYFARENVLPK